MAAYDAKNGAAARASATLTLMRVFIFRGSARYSGRIDADLEFGDRLVLVKTDGTVVLHARTGLQPRNWMPAGSQWEQSKEYVRITHDERGEMLELFIEQVLHDSAHDLVHDGRLVKLGSEREFSDLLALRLSALEPGLRLVAREFRTPAGPIDLLARTEEGQQVAIEVKRIKTTGLEVLYQLRRYLDALRHMTDAPHPPARGILVAPAFGRDILAALEATADITYARLHYGDLVERPADRE